MVVVGIILIKYILFYPDRLSTYPAVSVSIRACWLFCDTQFVPESRSSSKSRSIGGGGDGDGEGDGGNGGDGGGDSRGGGSEGSGDAAPRELASLAV